MLLRLGMWVLNEIAITTRRCRSRTLATAASTPPEIESLRKAIHETKTKNRPSLRDAERCWHHFDRVWRDESTRKALQLRDFGELTFALLQTGVTSRAKEILSRRKRAGFPLDALYFNQMALTKSDSLTYQDATDLLKTMRERNLRPQPQTLGILVKILCEKGDFEGARKLCTIGRKFGASPNVIVYNTLIAHLGKSGRLSEAQDLLKVMREKGLRPTIRTYSALIKSFVQHYAEADPSSVESTYTEMRNDGISPDPLFFNVLFHFYARRGDLLRAESLLTEMKSSNLVPDNYTFSTLIHAFGNGGSIQQAEQLFEDAISSGVADEAVFNTMIKMYVKAGNLEAAVASLERMREHGVSPSAVTLTTLLSAHAQHEKLDDVLKWVEKMEHRGIKVDRIFYNTAIHACAQNGNVQKAQEFLARMRESGIRPDGWTYASLLGSFTKAKDWVGLERCVADMQREDGVRGDDIVLWNAALKAFVDQGDPEKVWALWREIKRTDGIVPNARTYCILIDFFGKAGDFAKVDTLWDHLRRHRVEPDRAIFDTLMWSYAEHRKTDDMLRVLRDCKASNIRIQLRKDVVKAVLQLGGNEAASLLESRN
ncbi:hypothetical protein HK102_004816 [Quaeritorhiza haematococci]|nr:hypothetical protein HK102_004816 [Quaeritorhiza haematococci]